MVRNKHSARAAKKNSIWPNNLGNLFMISVIKIRQLNSSILSQIFKLLKCPLCKSKETLLLLLSRFSRVRLCATPWTAAHQAPPSLGFSRQEHGVGCHFLLQCMQVKSESEVAQSCPTFSDPMDYQGVSSVDSFQAVRENLF